MKILHLTLKKKWFDMIASGEKKEEYRELKPYWIRRLTAWNNAFDRCRDFTAVQFRNGYSKDAPTLLVKCEGITVSFPNQFEDWCDEADKTAECFVIKLGAIMPNSSTSDGLQKPSSIKKP